MFIVIFVIITLAITPKVVLNGDDAIGHSYLVPNLNGNHFFMLPFNRQDFEQNPLLYCRSLYNPFHLMYHGLVYMEVNIT